MRIRSLLFAPGNDRRKADKAFGLGADAVALDLEDAVADSAKEAARLDVVEALRSDARSPSLRIVRVNSLGTGLTEGDLEAVVLPELDGILLPMVADAEEVRTVSDLLDGLEAQRDLQPGSVRMYLLIETALGIINAYAASAASPRIAGVMFGPGDYTLDIGTQMTVEGLEVLYARSHVVTAARAAGLPPPIDGPFTRLDDLEGFELNARTGRALGYGGKAVIHPSQLPVCHRVFDVSEDELAWARRVDEAFTEAERRGSASIRLSDGEFVDYPIAYRARGLLKEARARDQRPE